MSDQSAFHAALMDAARPVPEGLRDPAGRPAGKRFDVYRNNVAVSLTRALETGFPVLRKLVGAEFFSAMAGVYLRTHPPTSPLLQQYGQDMPGFLRGFPPAKSLPYLPDIARLELARAARLSRRRLPAIRPCSAGRARQCRTERGAVCLCPGLRSDPLAPSDLGHLAAEHRSRAPPNRRRERKIS